MSLRTFPELSEEDKQFVLNDLTLGKCRPRLNSKRYNVFSVKDLERRVKRITGYDVKNMNRTQLCGMLFFYRNINKDLINEDVRVNELRRQLNEKQNEIDKLKKIKNPVKQIEAKSNMTRLQLQQTEALLKQKEIQIASLQKMIDNLESEKKKANDTGERVVIEQEQNAVKNRVEEVQNEQNLLTESLGNLTEQLKSIIPTLGSKKTTTSTGTQSAGTTTGSSAGASADASTSAAASVAAFNTAQMDALKRSYEKSLKKIEALTDERDVLAEQLRTLSQTGTSAIPQATLDKFRGEVQTRQTKINQLEKDLGDLQKAKSATEKTLAASQKEVDVLEGKVSKLEKQVGADVNTSMFNLSNLFSRRKSTEEKLQKDVSLLKTLQGKIEDQKKELETAKKTRDAEITTLKAQVASQKKRITDLESIRRSLAEEKANLSAKATTVAATIQKETQKTNDAKEKALEAEIASLNTKIESFKREVDEKTKQIRDLQAKLESERKTLQKKFDAELEKRQETIGKLENEIKTLGIKLQAAESAKEQLLASTVNSEKERVLMNDIQEKEKEIKLLKQDSETKSKRISELESQVQKLESDLKSISKKETNVQTQISKTEETLKTQNEKLQKQIVQKEEEIKKLNAQVKSAAVSATASSVTTAATSALEEKLSSSEKQIGQLQKQLSEKQSALEKAAASNQDTLVAKLQEDNKRIEQALALKEKEVVQLTDRVKQLVEAQAASKAVDATPSATELENKLQSAQATVSELKQKQIANTAAMKQVEQAKTDLEENVKKITQEKNAEIAKLTKEIAGLKTASSVIPKKEQEIEALQQQLADFQKKMAEAADVEKKLSATIASLQEQLDAKSREVDELETVISELTQSTAAGAVANATKPDAVAAISPELLRLQKQLNEKESQIQKLRAAEKNVSVAADVKLKAAQDRIAELEKQVRVLDKKAQSQLESGTLQIEQLTREVKERQSKLEAAEAQVEKERARAKEQLAIAQQSIATLENDVKELSNIKPSQVIKTGIDEKIVAQKDALIAKLTTQVGDLEKSIAAGKATIEKLDQKLKDETDRLETIIAARDKEIASLEGRLRAISEVQERVKTQSATIEKHVEDKQAQLAKIQELEAQIGVLREHETLSGELKSKVSDLEKALQKETEKSQSLEKKLEQSKRTTQEDVDKRIKELEAELEKTKQRELSEKKLSKEITDTCDAEYKDLTTRIGNIQNMLETSKTRIASLNNIIQTKPNTIINKQARDNIAGRNKYASQKAELDKMNEIVSKAKTLGSTQCAAVNDSLSKINKSRPGFLNVIELVQNDWEDSQGVSRVYLRLKPPVDNADKTKRYVIPKGDFVSLNTKIAECQVDLVTRESLKEDDTNRFGPFKDVFAETQSNQDIFSEMRDIIRKISTGYRVVVFTYGQSGSGKTFTLLGDGKTPGVVQQTLSVLVDLQKDIKQIDISARQIYKNNIYDVLAIDGKVAPIKENDPERDTKQINIKGGRLPTQGDVSAQTIRTIYKYSEGADATQAKNKLISEFNKNLREIQDKRPTRATPGNPESSRSHLFITLRIEFSDEVARRSGRKTTQLTFVDVAGNEDISAVPNGSESQKEGRNIRETLDVMLNLLTAHSQGISAPPGVAAQSLGMKKLVEDVADFNERKLLTKIIMFLNVHTYFKQDITKPGKEQERRRQVNNQICTTTMDTLNIGQRLIKGVERKKRPRGKF